MKKTWYTFKLFYLLLKISRNPENTPAILAITHVLLKLNLINHEAQKLNELPEFRPMYLAHKLMAKIDLQALQKCPEGSVGKIFSDHMISQNLDPQFYDIIEIKNEETYLMMRLRETHDLWHIITGFNTTVPGELGLQAFMLAQTYSPLAMFLIAGGLFRSALIKPAEAREIIRHVTTGWQMGLQGLPLFPLDWEANWSTPLTTLRSQYKITPAQF